LFRAIQERGSIPVAGSVKHRDVPKALMKSDLPTYDSARLTSVLLVVPKPHPFQSQKAM
jgi:hypothetical protein